MNAPKLSRLSYISHVPAGLSAVDIQVIVNGSQVRNRRADITGILVYAEGYFLQILEGRREAVRGVMQSIAGDARHCQVQQSLETTISRRLFDGWSMGYLHCPELSSRLGQLHRSGTITADVASELAHRVRAMVG